MEQFLEYSSLDGKIPPKTGAYNIIIFSRDNVPVISVAYYDATRKEWFSREIEEFGYANTYQMNANIISYFKPIDCVKFNVIPQEYDITIAGVMIDDQEDDN